MSTVPHNSGSRLVAVLGPTNTGKTHYAVERMLGHASGMIGFPLRLLAREVYDRVVAIKGKTRVALVTGEEKIMPANPAYFICTVEAMPLDRSVGFLAIDEIQMCADDQRGHVFTNRLLHARGSDETMFMGADTIRPLLRRLLPGIKIVERPRFSQLRYSAPKKLSRLPRRSALVAFSAENVYAAAELLRRQRGGCAIVMGALSPRTRNAQVALYQSGEVDYLVATDAIGMGLNMDIDHVVFADLRKFDGRRHRDLSAAELAQIAGRAGRHMNDGTFSTLSGGAPARNGARNGTRNGNGANGAAYGLDPQIITRIEEHNFQRLKVLMWRNARLDYRTPAALIKSLEAPATRDGLTRAGEATDLGVLRALAGEADSLDLATSPEGVQRLWEVAQLPDFRKISMGSHVRLAAQLYAFRMAGAGEIPPEWMAAQVSHLDNIQGDIDTLAARIAGIRIWTYVAHRSSWLADPAHWAGVTRTIENKLSDALHEGLMQRFVDRRTAVLMRALKQKGDLLVDIEKDGGVSVEGHALGQLQGFAFLPDSNAGRDDQRSLKNAAERAVKREIETRAKAFATADDSDIAIAAGENLAVPKLTWKGVDFASMAKGESLLRPRIKLLGNSMLEGDAAAMVLARARKWMKDRLAGQLGPLDALARELAQEPKKQPGKDSAKEAAKKPEKEPAKVETAETADDAPAPTPEAKAPPAELSGLARGIAFRLVENLGVMPRREVAAELRQVDAEARKGLHRFRIRIGASTIFMPQVLKPAATELRLMLWAIFEGLSSLPQPPTPGMVWCAVEQDVPEDFYRIAGFRKAGNKAVRVDMAERLADAVRPLGQNAEGFEVNPDIMGLVGLAGEDFIAVMRMIGYGHEKRQVDAPPPPPAQPDEKASPADAKSAEQETEAKAEETAAPVEGQEEKVEKIFFRWRPERTAKPRQARPRRTAKPADRKGDATGQGNGRKSAKPKRRPRQTRHKPREAPLDENSPFAVLKGLKASLEKGRKQGAK